MDACATFGNQHVLFSKKQINNMRAFFGSHFILFSIFLTQHQETQPSKTFFDWCSCFSWTAVLWTNSRTQQ